MMQIHPAYPKLLEAAKEKHGGNVFAVIEETLQALKKERNQESFSKSAVGLVLLS